jgi:hypothetical protein
MAGFFNVNEPEPKPEKKVRNIGHGLGLIRIKLIFVS